MSLPNRFRTEWAASFSWRHQDGPALLLDGQDIVPRYLSPLISTGFGQSVTNDIIERNPPSRVDTWLVWKKLGEHSAPIQDDPFLHHAFMELLGKDATALAVWAGKYGPLGPYRCSIEATQDPLALGPYAHGEPVGNWMHDIATMKMLFHVWMLAKIADDAARLELAKDVLDLDGFAAERQEDGRAVYGGSSSGSGHWFRPEFLNRYGLTEQIVEWSDFHATFDYVDLAPRGPLWARGEQGEPPHTAGWRRVYGYWVWCDENEKLVDPPKDVWRRDPCAVALGLIVRMVSQQMSREMSAVIVPEQHTAGQLARQLEPRLTPQLVPRNLRGALYFALAHEMTSPDTMVRRDKSSQQLFVAKHGNQWYINSDKNEIHARHNRRRRAPEYRPRKFGKPPN